MSDRYQYIPYLFYFNKLRVSKTGVDHTLLKKKIIAEYYLNSVH
jgi:hypothetical protein